MTTTIVTTMGLFSNETSLILSKNVCFTSLDTLERCGRYIKTKTIVPINKKELNKPKSFKATDCKGTNAKNAPTVVILPTKRGMISSRNACFF